MGSGQGDLSSGNRNKFVGRKFNVTGSELLLVIFSQKVSALFLLGSLAVFFAGFSAEGRSYGSKQTLMLE